MTRILTIDGRTGLFDFPSFLLSENESLKIKLRFKDEIRTGRFRLVVKQGEFKKTFSLSKNEEIELSPAWLTKGGENLEFSLVFCNATETAVIKDDYQIEPLKLETVNGNFVFSALVQEIIAEQKRQAEILSEMQEKLNQYEDEGVPVVLEQIEN